jgi:hypothetical protein
MMPRPELTRLPMIKSAVKNRWPQLAVFIAMLGDTSSPSLRDLSAHL